MHEVFKRECMALYTNWVNPNFPEKAVGYYYQVRSNIIHRGKGAVRDFGLLKTSLEELLPIFREVLKTAEQDARWSAMA
jgi:hypothetical protein